MKLKKRYGERVEAPDATRRYGFPVFWQIIIIEDERGAEVRRYGKFVDSRGEDACERDDIRPLNYSNAGVV